MDQTNTLNHKISDLTLDHLRSTLQQHQLPDSESEQLLSTVGFQDPAGAYRCLKRIGQTAEMQAKLADILPQILHALAEVADPNDVLINFERLIQNADTPLNLLDSFAHNPRTLEILTALFTSSQFLTEILLSHPDYFPRLTAYQNLAQQKSATQLQNEAQQTLDLLIGGQTNGQLTIILDALRRFQRWELLRIGAADLLGAYDFTTVTTQLSHVADSLIEAALIAAGQQTKTDVSDFFVIGMGKLGGAELNYSSDIDLIFLAKENASSYLRMGQILIDILTRTTGEGFLYRVDMRLRPWGQSGALVATMDGYATYLEKHAGLWEKQALLKARVVAGNKTIGEAFLQQIQPLIFEIDSKTVRQEVHRLKQKIEEKLHKRGQDWGEVKQGRGSIRDIEFTTQYLQLQHGRTLTDLRTPQTLEALTRLVRQRILSPEAYRALADGYTFLRTIEHHLQLMHYQQTHQLPNDAQALRHLARRLGFQGDNAGKNFIANYEQHSKVIRLVYQEHLADEEDNTTASQTLLPHLTRLHPTYVTTFSDEDINHHASLVESLDKTHVITVETVPLDEHHWRVTIVGFDDLGLLSLICGLLFLHEFNIVEGHIFSYGPQVTAPTPPSPPRRRGKRRSMTYQKIDMSGTQRKIVDVFTVRSTTKVAKDKWQTYKDELSHFATQLHQKKQHEVQGFLAKQVALKLSKINQPNDPLHPVDILIDNEISQRHTVLKINAPDTVGFLYEFTNALTLNKINIRRMDISTAGNRVQDTLYVTDATHKKITDPNKQHELRVATALIKQFTHTLPQSPNPEAALLHFHEFLGQLFTRSDWANELTSLEQPEVLHRLARLLGVSDFLWDDFLRMQHENLFPMVRDEALLKTAKSKDELRAELETLLQQGSSTKSPETILNTFKDREMFRIDMRQILNYTLGFEQFAEELTDLADIIVEATYRLAAKSVRDIYGLPRLANGRICPIVVCALGKCGGRELGFASDIELIFIYEDNGHTTGPKVITTAEYFNKLVQEVPNILRTRQEGIFEIDLRLRPYGSAGSMAVSLNSFETYFGPEGEAWPYERQALIRLRPLAGDKKFGQKVSKIRDSLIYRGQPFDVAAMRAMRERQLRQLVTAGTINAKFSAGGLVDLEYLIQGLQITYGHRSPELRSPNTHETIDGLYNSSIINRDDYIALREALIFMRHLINALRMVRGNAKDLTVPPTDSEEFAFLARRLDYPHDKISYLRNDLLQHTVTVQEVNARLLNSI